MSYVKLWLKYDFVVGMKFKSLGQNHIACGDGCGTSGRDAGIKNVRGRKASAKFFGFNQVDLYEIVWLKKLVNNLMSWVSKQERRSLTVGSGFLTSKFCATLDVNMMFSSRFS